MSKLSRIGEPGNPALERSSRPCRPASTGRAVPTRETARPTCLEPAAMTGSTVTELLRLFVMPPSFPDSTPRISHHQLATRLEVAPAELVRLLERDIGDDVLAGVLVVQRDPKPVNQSLSSPSTSSLRDLAEEAAHRGIAALLERGGA